MESRSHHDDEIERYLRQEMGSEERADFERRIQNDDSLNEEVALQEDIIKGINLFGDESLKKQLQEAEAEGRVADFPLQDQKPGRSPYVWIGVAASVSVLLLATILFFNQRKDPQQLYAAYYRPYPNVVNPSQRSADVPSDAAGQAMYYYERGDYEKTIELLTQESALSDPPYQFYLGISYLSTQQTEKAIITLQNLLQDQQGGFYEPALWYTGLAYLQASQLPEAKKILQQVVAFQGDYQVEAQNLLNEMG